MVVDVDVVKLFDTADLNDDLTGCSSEDRWGNWASLTL